MGSFITSLQVRALIGLPDDHCASPILMVSGACRKFAASITVSYVLASCGGSPPSSGPAPRLAQAPQTLSDLQALAAHGHASAVHEFNHSTPGTSDCDASWREVTVDAGLSAQQLASDLLAYFFQLPGNPCRSELHAYHSQADQVCHGFGCPFVSFTAGLITLAVGHGQQTLTLDLGSTGAVSEYVVTYTCGPGVCLPGPLGRGTYTTQNFLPGMTITVPTDGFSSCDDSTAEFQLQPFADHPSGATISFWVNPHAVDKDVVRVSGVPGTPAALIAWLKRNPDLVVSGPTTRTIGAGIEATSVDLEVADSAPSVAADLACPGSSQTDIRSAAGLRDPLLYLEFGGIFGDNTPSPGYGLRYGSSPGEPVRLYFASIGSGRTANTLVISVDAFRPSDFASLAAIAETIIHSLRLPAALPPAPR